MARFDLAKTISEARLSGRALVHWDAPGAAGANPDSVLTIEMPKGGNNSINDSQLMLAAIQKDLKKADIPFTTPDGKVTFRLGEFNYSVLGFGDKIVIDPQRIKEETLFSGGIAAVKRFFALESNAQRSKDQLAAQAALGFDSKKPVIEHIDPAQDTSKGALGDLSAPTMTASATMDRSNQRST